MEAVMPWWFWLLAVAWIAPVGWAFARIGREFRDDRRIAKMEARAEALAERAHMGGARGGFVAPEDAIDPLAAQASNPRRLARVDHWRI